MSEEFKDLVSMTLEEAKAAAYPYKLRVVKVDGQYPAVTRDMRPDRVNVEVEGGLVSAVKGLY